MILSESLVWAAIGVTSGLALGLTGAGGAIAALPLFLHALHLPLYQATICNLIVLIMASLVMLAFKRRDIPLPVVLRFLPGVILGSVAMLPVKPYLPEAVIVSVILAVILPGVVVMWRSWLRSSSEDGVVSSHTGWGGVALVGIGVLGGMITAITGLSGGLLFVPALKWWWGMSDRKAVAASLSVVTVSSSVALAGQFAHLDPVPHPLDILALLAGLLVVAVVVHAALDRMSPSAHKTTTVLAYTVVAAMALIGLALR